MDTNDIKNQKHIQTTYLNKAQNLLKICMGIFGISISSYLIIIIFWDIFDFGIIFEVLSFVFVLLAYFKLFTQTFKRAKKFIIIAMIPIALLIIYDFICLLVNADEVITNVGLYYLLQDQKFYNLKLYLFDACLTTIFVLLYRAIVSTNKASGDTKPKNYTDTFYDSL